jgi:enoyl-CoA hydratase/carnithine racemase
MPTLALINGDAIGHGLLLALCHDLRIQNNVPSASLRICAGSSEPGGPAPQVASLIKARLSGSFNRDAYQSKLIKLDKALNPREAIRAGFAQGIGHLKEALGMISRLKLLDVGSNPAYWSNKEAKNRVAIDVCDRSNEAHSLYKL